MIEIIQVLQRFDRAILMGSTMRFVCTIVVIVMMWDMGLVLRQVRLQACCASATQQMDEITLRGHCGLPRQ